MTLYWPMAIIKRGKEYDIQHTYDGALTYDSAMKQIKIWKNDYHMNIIAYWIDETEDGIKRAIPEKIVDMKLVKELWNDFGDVPINSETECIEDFWGQFVPGDHREKIWHWFEDTFYVSVAEDLM